MEFIGISIHTAVHLSLTMIYCAAQATTQPNDCVFIQNITTEKTWLSTTDTSSGTSSFFRFLLDFWIRNGLQDIGQVWAKYASGTCPRTEAEPNPWFLLRLNESYFVTSVTITTADDAPILKNFKVEVGSVSIDYGTADWETEWEAGKQPCSSHEEVTESGSSITATCTTPLFGNYVKISTDGDGSNVVISLCEILVNGKTSNCGDLAASPVSDQPPTETQSLPGSLKTTLLPSLVINQETITPSISSSVQPDNQVLNTEPYMISTSYSQLRPVVGSLTVFSSFESTKSIKPSETATAESSTGEKETLQWITTSKTADLFTTSETALTELVTTSETFTLESFTSNELSTVDLLFTPSETWKVQLFTTSEKATIEFLMPSKTLTVESFSPSEILSVKAVTPSEASRVELFTTSEISTVELFTPSKPFTVEMFTASETSTVEPVISSEASPVELFTLSETSSVELFTPSETSTVELSTIELLSSSGTSTVKSFELFTLNGTSTVETFKQSAISTVELFTSSKTWTLDSFRQSEKSIVGLLRPSETSTSLFLSANTLESSLLYSSQEKSTSYVVSYYSEEVYTPTSEYSSIQDVLTLPHATLFSTEKSSLTLKTPFYSSKFLTASSKPSVQFTSHTPPSSLSSSSASVITHEHKKSHVVSSLSEVTSRQTIASSYPESTTNTVYSINDSNKSALLSIVTPSTSNVRSLSGPDVASISSEFSVLLSPSTEYAYSITATSIGVSSHVKFASDTGSSLMPSATNIFLYTVISDTLPDTYSSSFDIDFSLIEPSTMQSSGSLTTFPLTYFSTNLLSSSKPLPQSILSEQFLSSLESFMFISRSESDIISLSSSVQPRTFSIVYYPGSTQTQTFISKEPVSFFVSPTTGLLQSFSFFSSESAIFSPINTPITFSTDFSAEMPSLPQDSLRNTRMPFQSIWSSQISSQVQDPIFPTPVVNATNIFLKKSSISLTTTTSKFSESYSVAISNTETPHSVENSEHVILSTVLSLLSDTRNLPQSKSELESSFPLIYSSISSLGEFVHSSDAALDSIFSSVSFLSPSSSYLTAVDSTPTSALHYEQITYVSESKHLSFGLQISSTFSTSLVTSFSSTPHFFSLISSSTSSISVTEQMSSYVIPIWCPCSCEQAEKIADLTNTNKTSEQVALELEVILIEQTVDAKTTSSSQRKLSSATDERKSSRVVGTVGIAFFVIVISLIVLADLPILIQIIQRMIQQLRFAKETQDPKRPDSRRKFSNLGELPARDERRVPEAWP